MLQVAPERPVRATPVDGDGRGAQSLCDAFTEAFAAAWSRPTPGKLVALLHPDVVLYQPYRRPIRGKDEAYREFNRLLAWLPGLHGAVVRSAGVDSTLFIEWQIKVPVGGKITQIHAVDRFRLDGDLAIERAIYFDRMALARVLLNSPARWLGYINYQYSLMIR